jgi:probable F420-dependent oxidoreductase
MAELGMTLPQSHPYDLQTDVAAAARTLEEIGYDSLWAFERVLVPQNQSGAHGFQRVPNRPWPPFYHHAADPVVTLATAAAVTKRARLGTNVLVPPLHLPLHLARSLASLDAVSGGRLIAGLGTGWSDDEFGATAPRPFAERGPALDEFLNVAEAVWRPDPVSFRTVHHSADRALIGPKPAGRIPVYLAATNRTTFRRIAARADGWLPNRGTPDDIRAGLQEIRDLAASYGRDPSRIGCIFQLVVMGRPEPKELAKKVAALNHAGIDHVFVTLTAAIYDRADLLTVAADIHAAVRAARL